MYQNVAHTRFTRSHDRAAANSGMSQFRMSPSYLTEYPKLGWMGKRIQKKILDTVRAHSKRRNSLPLRRFGRCSTSVIVMVCALICGAFLAGCAENLAERLQSGKVMAWDGLLGRWAGPVAPTAPSCGGTTEGLLSIGTDGFGFDPFQSTTVISGKVASDGRLAGTFVRTGGSNQSLSISFDAAPADGDTIRGTLASGRCHWSVTLHRS